ELLAPRVFAQEAAARLGVVEIDRPALAADVRAVRDGLRARAAAHADQRGRRADLVREAGALRVVARAVRAADAQVLSVAGVVTRAAGGAADAVDADATVVALLHRVPHA